MRAVRKGLSPIISTVLITATLLVILVVAFYLAVTLLAIQVQSSEFEQAKTAMMILDRTIADVALRPGAASSVTFNQRTGGVGIYEGGMVSIKIYSNSTLNQTIERNSYVIKYRGGSMVSTAEMDFTKPESLIVNASKPLGYVRVEVRNGVWVALDYNRVRVTVNDVGIMDIYFIRLVPGTTWGSGTVTVRVQNIFTNVTTITFDPCSYVRIYFEADNRGEYYPDGAGLRVSAVRFIETTIVVFIM